jgi:Fe-S cluster assembly iron-binding protein IscA
MVAVTERAKDVLLERKLAANISEPEIGLRVSSDPSGLWVLVADRPRADDQIVEHKGATVLLIGSEMSDLLAGAKVDCEETAGGDVELVVMRSGIENGQPSC